MNERTRAGLKIFFAAMSGGMVVLVIMTSLQSNMFELPAYVVNEPWFKTTLVDFYFNIAILSAWIIYRERTALSRAAWISSFIVLGSIATSFYVFLQLARLKEGDGLEKVLLRKES